MFVTSEWPFIMPSRYHVTLYSIKIFKFNCAHEPAVEQQVNVAIEATNLDNLTLLYESSTSSFEFI